jgi:hypothetical protein
MQELRALIDFIIVDIKDYKRAKLQMILLKEKGLDIEKIYSIICVVKNFSKPLSYYSNRIKTKKSDSAEIERHYWLRSATATYSFYVASNFGAVLSSTPDFKLGVSPAFRIG